MYGISIYGIFVYNPFLFFFFLRFLNSIFYDDLIPSDPRGISSSSSTCSSSASASSCLQTQWIQICSNHNQDFFFITVDSLFNMKYLAAINPLFWIKSREYKIESTKLLLWYHLVHNCQNKLKQDIKIYEGCFYLVINIPHI